MLPWPHGAEDPGPDTTMQRRRAAAMLPWLPLSPLLFPLLGAGECRGRGYLSSQPGEQGLG